MTALQIFDVLDRAPVSECEMRQLVGRLALMVDVLQMQMRDLEMPLPKTPPVGGNGPMEGGMSLHWPLSEYAERMKSAVAAHRWPELYGLVEHARRLDDENVALREALTYYAMPGMGDNGLKARMALNPPFAGGNGPGVDADGDCMRCGCHIDPDTEHECPSGFQPHAEDKLK